LLNNYQRISISRQLQFFWRNPFSIFDKEPNPKKQTKLYNLQTLFSGLLAGCVEIPLFHKYSNWPKKSIGMQRQT
jgi:hypothetical protein